MPEHFYRMALSALEYGCYWFSNAKILKRQVDYVDKYLLDQVLAKCERVILLYPHFTPFEAGVFALNQDVALMSAYSAQKKRRVGWRAPRA